MPRKAHEPPPSTDIAVWLSAFVDELQALRPHVSFKLAHTIGRSEFLPDLEPVDAARAYHRRQGATPPRRRPKR